MKAILLVAVLVCVSSVKISQAPAAAGANVPAGATPTAQLGKLGAAKDFDASQFDDSDTQFNAELPVDLFPNYGNFDRNSERGANFQTDPILAAASATEPSRAGVFKEMKRPSLPDDPLFAPEFQTDVQQTFPNGQLPKWGMASGQGATYRRKQALLRMQSRGKRIQTLTTYVTSGSIWLTKLEKHFNSWLDAEVAKGKGHIDDQKQQLDKVRAELKSLVDLQRGDAKKVNMLNSGMLKAQAEEEIAVKNKLLEKVKAKLALKKKSLDELTNQQKQLAQEIGAAGKTLEVNKKLLKSHGWGDFSLLPPGNYTKPPSVDEEESGVKKDADKDFPQDRPGSNPISGF